MEEDEKQRKLEELMRKIDERDKGTLKGEGFIVYSNPEQALADARENNEKKKKLFEERKRQREAKKAEALKQKDSGHSST